MAIDKIQKIGGLWVSDGAECLRSNRTEWNRKIGEKQRKNSNIITTIECKSVDFAVLVVHHSLSGTVKPA